MSWERNLGIGGIVIGLLTVLRFAIPFVLDGWRRVQDEDQAARQRQREMAIIDQNLAANRARSFELMAERAR